MSFYIKFDDIQTVDTYTRSKLSEMQTTLQSVWNAINTLAHSNGFEGAAAGRAQSYLSEVQGVLYSSIQIIMTEYQQLMLTYKDGYHHTIDSDLHARFDEDELLGLEQEQKARSDEFATQAAELETAVGTISDLLTYFGPTNATAVADTLAACIEQATTAREQVGTYEADHLNDLTQVRTQIQQIETVLDQYTGAHGSMMSSYDSESLAANTAFMSMYDTTLAIQQGQDARAPELEGVYARESERVEALEAEAARERVKWGWIKAVGAVVTIAVGVIVVVASAGTATPLVVVGAAGLMTVFGASNLVEAADDIRLGNMGDATTQAFNPLRDTVFQGNQTLYDVVDFAVCAVGTAGIPIAQAAKAGTVARGTVALAVGREALEDIAMQKAIQLGTPYLGPEAALAAAVLAGGAAGRRGGGGEPRSTHWTTDPSVRRSDVPLADRLPERSDYDIPYEWAEDTYAAFRESPDLALKISEMNPGISLEDACIALDNILIDTHPLGGGVYGPIVEALFDADPDIADAILRLSNGNPIPPDFTWLRHEIAEAGAFRDSPGIGYSEAHQRANAVANWESEIRIWNSEH